MSRLLLIDGTNVVMRCAFGGALAIEDAVPTAGRMIARLTATTRATHLVVAWDSPLPSWRRIVAPYYKAGRTTDTRPFVDAADAHFRGLGWTCVAIDGWEADDVVATLAARVVQSDRAVLVASSDSDLLACVRAGVTVARPQNGGTWEHWGEEQVTTKYGVHPAQLGDYKALVGEPGDNLPGVDGIGPKRAAKLLQLHGSLARLLAGEVPDSSNDAARVRNAPRELLLEVQRLTTVRTDAPVPWISAAQCQVEARAA